MSRRSVWWRSAVVALATTVAWAQDHGGRHHPPCRPGELGPTRDGWCVPPAQPLPTGARCPTGMIRIPEGHFTMGSPAGEGRSEEHPDHPVQVSAFCIDRTEVTVAAYERCAIAGACPTAPTTVHWEGIHPNDHEHWDPTCNAGRSDRQQHPINCVDWNQASAYCQWAGGQLPTEAQWEYAARGTDGRRYPWGNTPPGPDTVNACGGECRAWIQRSGGTSDAAYPGNDGWETTAPVGSHPHGASPFGVLDMAGNVWEWTADRYGDYVGASQRDPTGATTGTGHPIRGGGWTATEVALLRTAVRGGFGPLGRGHDLGFRCVRRIGR